MRKAWRWLLGSLAALALLVALFVWDALRRAEAAIDAHERQVALDIAALRAAHARIPSPEPPDPSPYRFPFSASNWQRLRELRVSGVFYDYEKADRWDSMSFPQSWLLWWSGTSHPQLSAKQLMTQLAFPGHWLRGGGVSRLEEQQRFEREIIPHWGQALNEQGLTVSELESSAGTLDRLIRSRPTLRDALEGERAMDRIRVLQVIRTRKDEECTLSASPDWRSVFLWRVFIARTLLAIDYMYRDYSGVDALPVHQRATAAKRINDELSLSRRAPAMHSSPDRIPNLYRDEAETLRSWTLMRLATAIKWFETERGGFPERLEDLAPKYIEKIPLCPATGSPFGYSKGTLTAPGSGPGHILVWKVSGKSAPHQAPRNP